METFMYFWLNYYDGNNHIKRIRMVVKNIDHLFCINFMAPRGYEILILLAYFSMVKISLGLLTAKWAAASSKAEHMTHKITITAFSFLFNLK